MTSNCGEKFDNSAEVSERLWGVQLYFCEPHHPGQRGASKNVSGPLREFFPKGVANETYREMLHST